MSRSTLTTRPTSTNKSPPRSDARSQTAKPNPANGSHPPKTSPRSSASTATPSCARSATSATKDYSNSAAAAASPSPAPPNAAPSTNKPAPSSNSADSTATNPTNSPKSSNNSADHGRATPSVDTRVLCADWLEREAARPPAPVVYLFMGDAAARQSAEIAAQIEQLARRDAYETTLSPRMTSTSALWATVAILARRFFRHACCLTRRDVQTAVPILCPQRDLATSSDHPWNDESAALAA